MPTPINEKTLFLGSFVHSKDLANLEFLHDSAVCVDETGVIVALERDCGRKTAEDTVLPKLGWTVDEIQIRAAQPGQFFFPGFIGL